MREGGQEEGLGICLGREGVRWRCALNPLEPSQPPCVQIMSSECIAVDEAQFFPVR